MSLEFRTPKYPKDNQTEGRVPNASCAPLRKDDEKNFHEFFVAVPEPSACSSNTALLSPRSFGSGAKNNRPRRNLPLLALMDGKIVADATLHQQLGGWKRHVGRVSVLVHPKYRGRGLAGRWWRRS